MAGFLRKGVPVNSKECRWLETLRPLKRALNGNMRAREENVKYRKCTGQTSVPQTQGREGSRITRKQGREDVDGPPSEPLGGSEAEHRGL